ncbi:hypothetical protein ACI65C_006181 [Semiaphis heraclei]
MGNFRAVIRQVYNCQGVLGFWRGNGLNLLKSSPEFAIKFSVYDYTKRQLKASRDDGHLNAIDRFVAGSMAGVVGQTFLYPLDALQPTSDIMRIGNSHHKVVAYRAVKTNMYEYDIDLFIVKTRLIVGQYTNIMDVVVKTYKSGGVWAFFRGFWPSTLSIFLFAGIDLMTYEHIKENYSYLHEKGDCPSWIVNFYSAFISNIVGVVICYPISTVITRLQVDDGHSNGTTLPSEKWDRRRLLTAKNFRSGLLLYRGITGSIVKILPCTSIGYVVYEELCKSFGVRMS